MTDIQRILLLLVAACLPLAVACDDYDDDIDMADPDILPASRGVWAAFDDIDWLHTNVYRVRQPIDVPTYHDIVEGTVWRYVESYAVAPDSVVGVVRRHLPDGDGWLPASTSDTLLYRLDDVCDMGSVAFAVDAQHLTLWREGATGGVDTVRYACTYWPRDNRLTVDDGGAVCLPLASSLSLLYVDADHLVTLQDSALWYGGVPVGALVFYGGTGR